VHFEYRNTIPGDQGFSTEDILWAVGIWSVILTLSPVVVFYVLMVAQATSPPRHCERSEAIHRAARRKNGLLRCARNDDDGASSRLTKEKRAERRASLSVPE